MANYETIMKQEGMLTKKAIKKTYKEEVRSDKKAFIRKEIADQVFDDQDAIADNAKMISLLITVISRLYDVMDAPSKALLDPNDKAMIEYVFSKFKTVNTRADVQFATEGIALVDRLMDRQGTIGTIITTA